MRHRNMVIHTTNMVLPTAALGLALMLAPSAQAQVPDFDHRWYVDASVDGGANDGSDWDNAFRHLQDALTAAAVDPFDDDEIWVAAGTYYPDHNTQFPDGTGIPAASFHLQTGVWLFAGFTGTGTEMERNERDPAANVTILNGAFVEPCGDPAAGSCLVSHPTPGCSDATCCELICAVNPSCCENAWIQACASSANLVCDTCGVPNAGPCDQENLTPGCADAGCCALICMPAPQGGGLALCCVNDWDADCAQAAAERCPPAPRGVFHVVTANGVDESAVLDGFTITSGNATAGAVDDGGGILITNASPAIVRCTVTGNFADEGGGVHVTGSLADPTLVNCVFIANHAREGAAMHVEFGSPRATLVNCLFADNRAMDHAGALDINGIVTIVNCTFVDNRVEGGTVDGGGGIWVEIVSGTTITNTILWGNIPNQIEFDSSGFATVSYSDVQDGWPGTGNIPDDPQFVDAPGGNFRLEGSSPCVDTGNMAQGQIPSDAFDVDQDLNFTEPTPDLDMRTRIVDSPDVTSSLPWTWGRMNSPAPGTATAAGPATSTWPTCWRFSASTIRWHRPSATEARATTTATDVLT